MLASALLCLLTVRAPSPSPSQDALAAVRAVFQRTQGATSVRDDVLVRRLVALGSVAAPQLFSLVTGEGLEALLVDESPGAWLCEPDHVSELALAALAELPELTVRELLRAHCAEKPEREVRVSALNVLGRQAKAAGLPLFLDILGACGEELEQRSVRAPAGAALLAILQADADAVKTLQTPLLAAPVALQRFACEALSGCGRSEAVTLLTRLLGHDRELDMAVIEGLAALGERYPWRVGADVAPLMRAALEREDPNLRASAARAVGRLRDPQAVPALIAALEDADETVAAAALWSLRQISAQTRLSTKAQWLAWFEKERAWWKQDGHTLLAGIDPADCSHLADSLRQLQGHPLGRDQAADALVTALPDFAPEPKVLVCSALARLGARRAVPALVELLFETAPEVRQAAWDALRALTGEDLPAEPRLWETYAFG